MKHLLWLVCVVGAAVPGRAGAQERPTVVFRDSERIALIGNEFFDKEQDQCYLETALTSRFPDKDLVFRNLGYAGDTVWADARALCAGWANFGPAGQGFERLRTQVREARPTLIFIAYGMNESFDGPRGVAHFKEGYDRLLNMLESETRARIVLVTPIAHEPLPPPLPNSSQHNKELAIYAGAIRQIGAERKLAVIDLFKPVLAAFEAPSHPPMTSDGIHLNPYGYWRMAAIMENAMGYPARSWRVELHAAGGSPKAVGARITKFQARPGPGQNFELRFQVTDEMLPLAPSPLSGTTGGPTIRITGLNAGRYTLKSDGATIATATDGQWSQGVAVHSGPDIEQEEQLRKLVIAKNVQYFNFWRPENDTYIFGYRKHEQGQNGVEIPRFIPLVEKDDARIARRRVLRTHAYVLTRDEPK